MSLKENPVKCRNCARSGISRNIRAECHCRQGEKAHEMGMSPKTCHYQVEPMELGGKFL